MSRKMLFSAVFALVFAAAMLLAARVTQAGAGLPTQQQPAEAPALITPVPTVVQDSSDPVWLNGWGGEVNDGGYDMRCSVLQGQNAKFTFTGTAVKWISEKTKVSGIAQVSIDGVNRGNFDLYPAGNPEYYTSRTFFGLTNARHTITITNTGNKNIHSGGTSVCVDAFVVGTSKNTANSHNITYSDWKGAFNTNASGGSYRVGGAATTQVLWHFTGNNITWMTAKGPKYGKAWVIIDGVSKGYVDLYASTQQWRVTKSYNGLGGGSHSIQILPLGQKNAASSGYGVVVDSLIVFP